MQKPLKLYVLVRSDLETTYRAVQGMHAAIAYYENGNTTGWHNDTLVVLTVRNERQLKEWAWMLDNVYKKKFAHFCEPDLNGQMTAIACVDTGEIFKKLPVAK